LNSASDHYGLRVALTWWPVGIALVAVYFTFLFRWMWGKVGAEPAPSYGRPPVVSSEVGSHVRDEE
jgi:hypothetical protein